MAPPAAPPPAEGQRLLQMLEAAGARVYQEYCRSAGRSAGKGQGGAWSAEGGACSAEGGEKM
jgi:hypothetical protein